MIPTVTAGDVAWLSEADMVEVDRVMVDDLHIELIQMMENAGRNLARLTSDLFSPASAVVVAGSGGNGGGGLVAARHLANHGVRVSVVLATTADRLRPVPAHQFDIIERMGIPVIDAMVQADVVVDAAIGYALSGNPRGRAAEMIVAMNAVSAPVLSLDNPSGLDVTSGEAMTPCVHADATMTLAAPKLGLRAAPEVGRLFVADISVPASVYGSLGVGAAPDFSTSWLLEVAELISSERS